MKGRTVALLALLVAACGTDYVDTPKLEQTIRGYQVTAIEQ